MSAPRLLICFVLAWSGSLLGVTRASYADETPSARLQFDGFDLRGQKYSLSYDDSRKARVFVFLSTSCPIANSYTQELNRLALIAPESVDFYGVVSESQVTREAAAKHFAEYEVKFPVLFDQSGLIAEMLLPSHVPEAFVIDPNANVVYHGAIDDAYASIGRRRVKVEHHYLRNAIVAVVENQIIAVSSTSAVGCSFSLGKPASSDSVVTYCRDIAPLIQTRCQNCHRPTQVAPFPLTTYDEAVAHADMIVEVTQRRIMPPWMPGPKSQHHFVGERRMTDRELDLLRVWVASGCPKGDKADLPPEPKFVNGWQLGKPDLVVKMSQAFSVPADGPDLLQNFVLPIDLPDDKLVAAVEFHPGNTRVVHHAVLFLDDKKLARQLDAATPEPGYANFGGPGFLPSGALGGWSVGNTARRLPNEMGRYLMKGSDIVVQVHYHPTGKQETDQSELGLFFVNKPVAESLAQPARLVGSIWMANYEMDIPPGERAYRRSTKYTIPNDCILVGIVPHLHLLGKSMTVTAQTPGMSATVLIDVPDWNYNWQDEYYYQRPFKLSAGTVLTVEAVFDNSSDNPSNPSSPPRRVTWGEETTDEMMFCFFLLSAEKTESLIQTIFDNLVHDLKQDRKEADALK